MQVLDDPFDRDLFMATYESLEETAKNSEIKQKVTYHMHNFLTDSLVFDAVVDASTKLRAPTVKERSVGILNIATRKIKVPLERKDIFTIVYYIIYNLHPHKTLTKMHLSAETTKLISLLWSQILPQALTNYVQNVEVTKAFNEQKGATYSARLAALKTYFDEKSRFEEIVACVRNNIDEIQYIHTRVFPEVYFKSDLGYETTQKIENLKKMQIEQEYIMYSQSHPALMRYSPYDVRCRADRVN